MILPSLIKAADLKKIFIQFSFYYNSCNSGGLKWEILTAGVNIREHVQPAAEEEPEPAGQEPHLHRRGRAQDKGIRNRTLQLFKKYSK